MATTIINLSQPIPDYHAAQLLLAVTDVDANPRDITNDRLIFLIESLDLTKDSDNGPTEIDKTDPVNGQATIKLNPGDLVSDLPGPHFYEVILIAVGIRATVVKGIITTEDSLITTV